MFWIALYAMVGIAGKLYDFFGFEVMRAEDGSENLAFGLLLSATLWPIPLLSALRR